MIMEIKTMPQLLSSRLRHKRNHLTTFKTSSVMFIAFCVFIFACPIQAAFDEGNNNNVKITKHGLELTQTINIQRQEYIQRQCEYMGYKNASLDDLTKMQMDHMIIDREHKFLYCYVPKVACTNWKRVLMLLNGSWKNGTDPLRIPGDLVHMTNVFPRMHHLSDEERAEVLSDYTRFIIVRDPFERLLSAFRNKFESDTKSASYFRKRIGRHIIKAFRVNASNHSLELGDDLTFNEFVRYLLTPNMSIYNNSYNEHWEPISNLCNPCVMKYNVVGKYETLMDDSALALYLAGATNLTFPTGTKPSSTREHLREYFDPLPIGAIRRLYEIYENDYRLFDYNLDDVLGFEFG